MRSELGVPLQHLLRLAPPTLVLDRHRRHQLFQDAILHQASLLHEWVEVLAVDPHDRCSDAVEELDVLDDRVAQVLQLGLQRGHLFLDDGQGRMVRQQPVWSSGVRDVRHHEGGEVRRPADPQLLADRVGYIPQVRLGGHANLPRGEVHQHDRHTRQVLALFVRSQGVDLGDAVPHDVLQLGVRIAQADEEKGPQVVVEIVAARDLLAEREHELPTAAHRSPRRVLRQLLHHLDERLVCQRGVGERDLDDGMRHDDPLHLGNGPIAHPTEDVDEHIAGLRILQERELRQRALDVNFAVR
mmetsp:Transcript_118537/g.342750  ORF Transcript_118537/g.342750 Transcript_118537/m.342750 type:complete len:299 (+) Transcript_118537:515-1411(+)